MMSSPGISAAKDTIQISFSQSARAFLTSLMAQRRKLIISGESRISRTSSMQAIEFISRHLGAYSYNADKDMARFIYNHYDSISQILPGPGSGCHTNRSAQLLEYYNRALQIIQSIDMRQFYYYRVSNDYGEAFVKTSQAYCWVISMSFEGIPEVHHFDRIFSRKGGDVIVEITSDKFKEESRRIVDKISNTLSI